MNSISRAAADNRKKETSKSVRNFMGGISYELNPIDIMKMVTASSIFGEPSYYRDGAFASARISRVVDGKYQVDRLMKALSVLDDSKYSGMKTSEIMEKVIDDALDYDFAATLQWAVTLRKDYNMRLNPQVIMVRAAMHPKRAQFNQDHPNMFHDINASVMMRADEPSSQMAYYLYKNGSKKDLPGVLKKDWAKKLESLDRYSIAKYKNANLGMIDVVRLSHASGPLIDELMKTGTVEIDDAERTWENLRSDGKSWKEIFDTVKVGHMARLRNIRGVFREIDDPDFARTYMEGLKNGVTNGKQFPFRYYSAWNAVENDDNVYCKTILLDGLEACMDEALLNMPTLHGRTMCLSDNSGSAWGNIPSEYGTVTIAEIDNLSSVIAAVNSDEGYIGKFGDRLKVIPSSKRNGILSQTKAISKDSDLDVGGSTECGIWLFFDKAIREKEWWDNIFIYSDMQAGHGCLYGTQEEMKKYTKAGFSVKSGRYIDVAKLVETYRSKVNPKVNVFSVQTAGYTNVLLPEYAYRGNVLYGWTGKELVFADTMIRFWDEKDAARRKADI